jgi:D-alanyl-D-alanine dipeptidase
MNKKTKDKIKYILWQFGLRKTIPASVINNIPIKENYEELVDIKLDKKLYLSSKLQQRAHVYLRKTVYHKIKQTQKTLPNNYFFKIYSAFRPLDEQIQLWRTNYQKIKLENPNLSEQELIIKTKAVCADPRFGFSGHQTGGAIDISLCDANGTDYDMGTACLEKNNKTVTDAKNLTAKQKYNRKILKDSLEKIGFKNYPGEWWHFCYGDRMWAAYSKQNQCFYGMPEFHPE